MLVKAGNQDAIRGRVGRFGQGCSPLVVGVIADFTPVDGTENNGWSFRLQHKSVCEERIDDDLTFRG